ncbi:hypothetical protein ACOMHN_000641 [Nucella lapillus]
MASGIKLSDLKTCLKSFAGQLWSDMTILANTVSDRMNRLEARFKEVDAEMGRMKNAVSCLRKDTLQLKACLNQHGHILLQLYGHLAHAERPGRGWRTPRLSRVPEETAERADVVLRATEREIMFSRDWGGVSVEDIIDCGVSVEDIVDCGVSVEDIVDCGVSVEDIVDCGVSVEDIVDCGVSVEDIVDCGVSVEDIVDCGVSLEDIVDCGVSVEDIVDCGVSVEDIVDCGVSVEDIVDCGVSVGCSRNVTSRAQAEWGGRMGQRTFTD